MIKGYDKLSDMDKLTFNAFYENYKAAQGFVARQTIVPISVKYEKDYIRFDYEINGRKTWLHVIGSRTWY